MRRMITTKQSEFVNELGESAKLSMMEDYELHNILFPNDDMEIEEDVADFEEHVYEGTIWCYASALYPDYQGESDEPPCIALIVNMNIPEDIDNDDDLLNWIYAHGLINAQIVVDEYYFFKGVSGSLYSYNLLPGTMPYSGGVNRLDVTVTPQGLMTNWTLQDPVNPVDTLKLGAQLTEIQNGLGQTQLTVNDTGVISNIGIPQTYSHYTPTDIAYNEGVKFKLSGLAASKHEHLLISAYVEDADGGEHSLRLFFQKRLTIDNHQIVKTWNNVFDIDLDDVGRTTGQIITFNPGAGTDNYWLYISTCDLTSITFYDVYSW